VGRDGGAELYMQRMSLVLILEASGFILGLSSPALHVSPLALLVLAIPIRHHFNRSLFRSSFRFTLRVWTMRGFDIPCSAREISSSSSARGERDEETGGRGSV